MSEVAHLLEVIRDAAARGEELSVALRACGLPGTERAAERLTAGATLPEAVAGLVPPRVAALLAGGLPPLATVAALLADDEWRAAERRRMITDHLAYPLASCALLSVLMAVIHYATPANPWYGSLISSAWAMPPALLALLTVCAPWAPRHWHVPGSGWVAHLDLASRWARAALTVQWRLTEAQALRVFGTDLQPLAEVLGSPNAESHCRLLADWHRRTARRRLLLTAFSAATLVLIAGGGLVLGTMRMWMAKPV